MSSGSAARSRTILVVDDTEMFRELQSLFLARQGRVVTAASGEEGLELARRHRPDVILLDLFMPGLDGDEVCRLLRDEEDLRDTPIVMLTASQRADDHERALRAGANQVLAKPLSRVSLVDVVSRYLSTPVPRGMPRVSMDGSVRIQHGPQECWGEAVNVSRGGMFVHTPCRAEPPEEVTLEFGLPRTRYVLTPTAQVVWRRSPDPEETSGLGVRFMRLDGHSLRSLHDYVQERFQKPL
jgi:CheY-like chemotaxis protein